MIIVVDGLLVQAEIAALNRGLAAIRFGDGFIRAGPGARESKNHLRIGAETAPLARPLIEAVVKAVDRSPLFFAATLEHAQSRTRTAALCRRNRPCFIHPRTRTASGS